jgi:transcription elongation factor Elf1
VKLTVKGALFRCGRCGKSYSNPFGHVCVTRLDRKERKGGTRLAPKVTASAGNCPGCGKPRGNALSHTCTVKTDFKKRRAIAKKTAAASQAHLYEACRDKDCQRVACRAYKEGREEGYQEGYQHGEEDGYAKGFPDGMAACPRKHA